MTGNRINVLQHGYVELVDHMGDDQRVVDAARMSTNSAGSKKEVRRLLRYLLRNRHTSPFEQVVFTFIVSMPIYVARQWVRHRTARLNELSGRYSELPAVFEGYESQGLPLQSKSNHQGSEKTRLEPRVEYELIEGLLDHNDEAFYKYNALLAQGVSKEVARTHLPLSTYTTMYWQMDLHNLLHFLSLRMDSHAQKEIRDYANAIYELIKPIVPLTVEAFEDYVLNSVTFSAQEVKLLGMLMNYDNPHHVEICKVYDTLAETERADFSKKLKKVMGENADIRFRDLTCEREAS